MVGILYRTISVYLILSLLCCGVSDASTKEHHSLWVVQGKHNKAYLLGSVHILKDGMTLPPAVTAAYDDAKLLVMELDRASLYSGGLKQSSLQLETLPEDQTLAAALGPELYAEFKIYASSLGFDTDFMSHYQPWFAAMTLQIYGYGKAGFNATSGVELQLLDKNFSPNGSGDAKPIVGLETMEEQLRLFSHLSMEEQRQYLHTTIQESRIQTQQLQQIVDAWQRGDLDELRKISMDSFKQSPEFYKRVVTDRNQKWLPKFIDLLNGRENCLIVVGVLHLVGDGGMIELLQHRGYKVVQQ